MLQEEKNTLNQGMAKYIFVTDFLTFLILRGKFYYERVLGGKRKIYLIERPRKENYLPEVLSEDEIISIINSITNIKHKALIMTIYSG